MVSRAKWKSAILDKHRISSKAWRKILGSATLTASKFSSKTIVFKKYQEKVLSIITSQGASSCQYWTILVSLVCIGIFVSRPFLIFFICVSMVGLIQRCQVTANLRGSSHSRLETWRPDLSTQAFSRILCSGFLLWLSLPQVLGLLKPREVAEVADCFRMPFLMPEFGSYFVQLMFSSVRLGLAPLAIRNLATWSP